MTKDDMNELLMGVAIVALGYALYKHFQIPAPAPAKVAGNTGVVGPRYDAIVQQPDYTGSPFTSLTDLLSGTTHDIGGFQGTNYLDQIADPMISGGGGFGSTGYGANKPDGPYSMGIER